MRVNTKRTRSKILELCRQDQRMADDDILLIATIWYQEGWRDPQLYQKLKDATNPETIRRTRAKLREEGLIKPSDDVDEARFDHMKQARDDL